MTYKLSEDLKMFEMPKMGETKIGLYRDLGVKLSTLKKMTESKPWNDEAPTYYCVIKWYGEDKADWNEEEIPIWAAKLFMDFSEEHADSNGELRCEYMRNETWNDEKKRMDSVPHFRAVV